MWASQKAKASREGTFLPCLTDQEITRMNPTHVHKHTDCYPGNKEKGPGGCVKFSSKDMCPWLKLKRNETNKNEGGETAPTSVRPRNAKWEQDTGAVEGWWLRP